MSLKSSIMHKMRRVRSRRGAAVFLTYHRIGDFEYDPMNLLKSEEEFEKHLIAFKERYTIMSAAEVYKTLDKKEDLPKNALVLTFDDGYSDLKEKALPLLEKYEAPATFYMITNRGLKMWWDKLALTLFDPSKLLNWNIEKEPVNDVQKLFLARVKEVDNASPTRRVELLAKYTQELQDELKKSSKAERIVYHQYVQQIIDSSVLLTDEELKELAAHPLVDIGAHTRDHQRLSRSSSIEQEFQILGSKRELEGILGKPVYSFSYPYGTSDSFTLETRSLVKKAGYLGAVTTELHSSLDGIPWGALYSTDARQDSRFHTPRVATVNRSLEEILGLVDKYLGY